VWVSAIDPLNLAGVILPGEKVAAQSGRGILFVDGLPQVPSETEAPAVKTPVPSKLMPRLVSKT